MTTSPQTPSTPDPDDRAAVRPVSRRNVLRAAGGLGLAGATALALRGGTAHGSQIPDAAVTRSSSAEVAAALRSGGVCTLVREADQGPFYLPGELVRRDIREGRPGVLLRLRLHVMDADTCEPLPAAAVDIWHCDAVGTYSGVAKRAEGEETDDSSTFLRGIQVTGDDGWCSFTTIVPGWYPGRTTHIHTTVHVDGKVKNRHYTGGHVCHTGQVFFPERLMKLIEKIDPYTDDSAERVHNKDDRIYTDQAGGRMALLDMRALVKGEPEEGYVGTIVLAVDPSAHHIDD